MMLTLPRLTFALFGGDPWYAAHTTAPVDPDACGIVWLRTPVLGDGMRWATETDRHLGDHVILDQVAFAELLFCSRFELDCATDDEIWSAIVRQLAACHCNIGECAGQLAQDYGDHPAETAGRMAECVRYAARLGGVSV